ncbi:MAG: hypothetical protein WCK81_03880 [Betaproteobacteria bacterium]
MKLQAKSTHRQAVTVGIMQVALSLALGACTQIHPPNSLVNDSAITAIDVNAKKALNTKDKEEKATPTAAPAPATGMDRYSGFNAAYKKAREKPLDGPTNAKFLTEGIALVQSGCSNYFTRMGNDGQHMGFAKKETSLAGGLTAALMGMFDASAKAISATAAGFGFTTATMDNFSDTYLFSPDIRAVQDLVMSALEVQRVYGDQIAKDVESGKGLSYTEATQFLLEMESYCQPHGVRAIITRAVGTQKAVPEYPSGSREQLQKAIDDANALAEKARAALDKTPAIPTAASSSPVSALRSQAIMLQTK